MPDFEGKRFVEFGLRVAAVAAGYYLGAFVGTVVSVPPFGFAIIWPATAFLIAILLITPQRHWWVYLTGVVLAHLHLGTFLQHPAAPLAQMLWQVAGNIGLAVATVLAAKTAIKPPLRFDNFRTVAIFMLLAGLAVPAIGNAVILGLRTLAAPVTDFWLSWRQWMLASIFPTITIPPLAALTQTRGWLPQPGKARRAYRESVLLAVALFALSFVAFGWDLQSAWWPALMLAPLPLLLWAAIRQGVAGTCLSLLALGAGIIVHALNGQGPFAVEASIERVISLQVFLIAISTPLILLAALMEDRQRTEKLLKESEARMAVIAASTDTGLWQWDEVRQRLWATEHCRSMLGLDPASDATPDSFLDIIHEEDRERVRASLTRMLESSKVEALDEFRVVRDGETRWFVMRSHTEFDADGRTIRVSGVTRDVTPRVIAEHQAKALSQRLLALQEEERRAIGMELHESASQDLVAVGLNLRALRRRLTLSDAAGNAMDEILAYLNQATNELRTLSFLLRPEGFQGEGLCAVLQRYVEGFRRRTGLQVTLRDNPIADRLPLDQQRAMLRVVQESLTSMHRHGGSERISIDLRCISDALHAVVVTKGAVVDQVSEQRLRASFDGMRARIEHLKGKMIIRARPEGAVVHAAIPLASEPASALRSVG